MPMTSVSVSILTHDRPRELLECVNSLIEQTVLPKEIIIVDNSSKNMSDVLSKIVDQVKRKSIQIKIVKGRDPYSVPIGRNQGLEAVSCEFVLICDDDVIFDKHYIETMLKTFKKYPQFIGLQGSTLSKSHNRRSLFLFVYWSLLKVFFLSRVDPLEQKVLPSGFVTMTSAKGETPTNAEWLISNNMMFKTQLIKKFRFDEIMIRYVDIDFTFRINKAYPNSLGIVKDAKIIDKHMSIKVRDQTKIITGFLFSHTYFFFKNLKKRPYELLAFSISRFGFLIIKGLIPLFLHRNSKEFLSCLKALLFSSYFCLIALKNRPQIKP
ncbi:hypothetical protein B9Q11_01690 [Candidatus Marsarchaeota G2 archaeon ECH_B_SAG-F08]|uniref:Glycosyltransferase 2-like domain-containing protein n=1 Tax=Candidatus Marsarchaeota G2 archaeon ECH_B_SAG-F08 TaxID=1978165 RepID=A0A2R6BJR5_9ARCH|nr:MAG: hypothetical protein B9Q11_01690 [Candidatus Marsarchaeota G2 archaeon ECH_B_SAG-F08]